MEDSRQISWTKFEPVADVRFTAPDRRETIDGGQAFSWNSTENENEFEGFFGGIAARLRLNAEGVPEASFPECLDARACIPKVRKYLDCDTDYGKMRESLAQTGDAVVIKALEIYPTLRILRQDPAEAIIGFICSSSKRIIQIKRCVRALAGCFGEEICPGYRALPTFERLARADVSEILKCGLGFRAAYLSSTSKKITAEKFEAENLRQMPYLEAKKYLLGLSGVGDKVADCILLFGCARMEAFPVDTWVRKAMKELYGTPDNPQKIRDFAARKFPDYAGFAQQAIFAAKRNGLL